MTCGVYEIVNKVNGKRYVGSSVNIEQRWASHRSQLINGKHHSPHLQRAWNKYGIDSFDWLVIVECHESEIICIEQREIDRHSDYNVAPVAGRNSGYRWTEEQREKHSKSKLEYYSIPENRSALDDMRKAHSTDEVRRSISLGTIKALSNPSVREKMSQAGRRNWTDVRREEASISSKKKIARPEHKSALIKANTGSGNGNYNHQIYTFVHDEHGEVETTQNALRKKYNLSPSHLSQVCSGKRTHHKGWKLKKAP